MDFTYNYKGRTYEMRWIPDIEGFEVYNENGDMVDDLKFLRQIYRKMRRAGFKSPIYTDDHTHPLLWYTDSLTSREIETLRISRDVKGMGPEDLSGWTSVSDADYSTIDLRERVLDRAYLRGCDLSGARLNHAHLSMSCLWHTKWTRADISSANLSSSTFRGAHGVKIRASRTNFSRGTFEKVSFREMFGEEADFAESYFDKADFTGAVLYDACFDGSEMNNVTFYFREDEGYKLKHATFRDCTIRNSSFRDCVLSHTSFVNARFVNVDFTGVTFRKVDFTGATFENCTGIDLSQARDNDEYTYKR